MGKRKVILKQGIFPSLSLLGVLDCMRLRKTISHKVKQNKSDKTVDCIKKIEGAKVIEKGLSLLFVLALILNHIFFNQVKS